VVQVSATAPDGSTLSNTATVSSATFDPNLTNNSATATTTVRAEADLGVSKSDSPDPVRPGGMLTYTIVVSNAGPNAAASVTMSDPLPVLTTFQSMSTPGGWACTTPPVGSTGLVSCTTATLGSGATATFSLVVQVSATAPDGSTLSNTATVSSATFDPDLANNTATATTSVRAADLAISKSAPPDATSGTDMTYHLTVTNNGPTPSTGGTVTDILPAGVSFQSAAGCTFTAPSTVSCTFGTLAVGSSVSFDIVVHISVLTAGAVTNTANVRGNETETNQGNNTATATTVVSSQTAPGKVTGGGVIDVPGGTANFGFVAQRKTPGGPVSGNLNYVDHASGRHLHVPITALTIIGNSAEFGGSCGPSCTFTVTVQDDDEPGAGKDIFIIKIVASPPYVAGGRIRSGNIQVRGGDLAESSQGTSAVTGAGAGIFPTGASFNGISLHDLRFGKGVGIPGDTSAAGDFQALLLGTSLLGQPQNITVVGRATSGSVNPDGSAVFTGVCTIDMGAGAAPLTGVPFSVTATMQGVRLILGTTSLPAATLTDGSITIE
jgi:uncharacterized repeat protein (TIGR01451 family)